MHDSTAEFALDPTHPSFKQTEGTEQLLDYVQKKRQKRRRLEKERAKRSKVKASRSSGPSSSPLAAGELTGKTAPGVGLKDPSLARLVESFKKEGQRPSKGTPVLSRKKKKKKKSLKRKSNH